MSVMLNASIHQGLIDILNFEHQWGLPSDDDLGVPKKSGINSDGIVRQLGAGYTAIVIIHEICAAKSQIFPEGTNIALKLFM